MEQCIWMLQSSLIKRSLPVTQHIQCEWGMVFYTDVIHHSSLQIIVSGPDMISYSQTSDTLNTPNLFSEFQRIELPGEYTANGRWGSPVVKALARNAEDQSLIPRVRKVWPGMAEILLQTVLNYPS